MAASSNTDLLSNPCTTKAAATAHNLATDNLRMDNRAMEDIRRRDTRSRVIRSRDMRSLDMEAVMGVDISRDRRRVEVWEQLVVRRWDWEVV